MKNEERIIGMIENLGKRFDSLDTKVTVINKDIGDMKRDIGTLKSDVGTLKSDVSCLKTDVADIKSSQSSMTETVLEMDRYMREELATKAELKAVDLRVVRLEKLQGLA